MVDHVNELVLPGEILTKFNESEKTQKALLGPGLRQEDGDIIVSKPGILKFREPNVYWVDSFQKRYIPTKSDTVIGIVTAKAGDIFRVDIGGSDQATLSFLAFEGATKRNRPDVKVGDLVYAKLLVANKDMEPELVCIDSGGKNDGLGVIGREGGFMINTSINLVRKLLSAECELFKTLGKNLQFEVAVGVNGRIWVKSRSVSQTIAVVNAIEASEFMTNAQIKTMCKKLADTLAGF
ncbi:hypothetical protein FSP39_018890 [Pinctada imbricata]|uniref:Exosome complex component RRP40 n=1 Tax=Pinctada imbricata TaxID=66713 RepID=A0AA88XT91_PINIB|nr:hypothetical protein FSP39_018890 [Pinctada imbricata]